VFCTPLGFPELFTVEHVWLAYTAFCAVLKYKSSPEAAIGIEIKELPGGQVIAGVAVGVLVGV